MIILGDYNYVCNFFTDLYEIWWAVNMSLNTKDSTKGLYALLTQSHVSYHRQASHKALIKTDFRQPN